MQKCFRAYGFVLSGISNMGRDDELRIRAGVLCTVYLGQGSVQSNCCNGGEEPWAAERSIG